MSPAIEAAAASQAALVDGRTVLITLVCVALAGVAAVVAQVLVRLIFFFTNVSFYGRFSFAEAMPWDNRLASAWSSSRSSAR